MKFINQLRFLINNFKLKPKNQLRKPLQKLQSIDRIFKLQYTNKKNEKTNARKKQL